MLKNISSSSRFILDQPDEKNNLSISKFIQVEKNIPSSSSKFILDQVEKIFYFQLIPSFILKYFINLINS